MSLLKLWEITTQYFFTILNTKEIRSYTTPPNAVQFPSRIVKEVFPPFIGSNKSRSIRKKVNTAVVLILT